MTNEQKLQVREALLRYTAGFDSQLLAAATLQGITPSIISQIKNNNWDLLSERVWHQVARQVGFYCGEWHPADTGAYLLLRILFGDAQHYNMTYAAAVAKGLGKTFTAGHYVREHEQVFYVAATADLNCRTFITALLESNNIQTTGTTPQLMATFTDKLSKLDEPLIIIDDAHLLKDRVLHQLVEISESLIGIAGLVVMGSDELRLRIMNGVQAGKAGYNDIYNTFGRRFITLGRLGPKDIELVCRANGIMDENTITTIADQCEGSLHGIAALVEQVRPVRFAA